MTSCNLIIVVLAATPNEAQQGHPGKETRAHGDHHSRPSARAARVAGSARVAGHPAPHDYGARDPDERSENGDGVPLPAPAPLGGRAARDEAHQHAGILEQ